MELPIRAPRNFRGVPASTATRDAKETDGAPRWQPLPEKVRGGEGRRVTVNLRIPTNSNATGKPAFSGTAQERADCTEASGTLTLDARS